MRNLSCVILAAGKGTRMKSATPKVLFDLCGRSIIEHVLFSVKDIKPKSIYIVVGYQKDEVEKKINTSVNSNLRKKIIFVEQKQQLGSADALLAAKKYISKNVDGLLVLAGDIPLISGQTLNGFLAEAYKSQVDCSVLTAVLKNPFSYGRIIKEASGRFVGIVEEVDANEAQKRIKEVNSGIYYFNTKGLWNALSKIRPNNKKKEYYLTDVVKLLVKKSTFQCKNPEEIIGINTRLDLSKVEKILEQKIIENLMLNGVSIINPESVYIDINTTIEQDTIIMPGSILKSSKIKNNCQIGPYSYIENSKVEDGTSIVYSHLTDCFVGSCCKVGPYSRIRPKTYLESNVKVGNFVEVKNSYIKSDTKINHLSYIGDTEIENNVNIGAGTITCNYDGIKKHKTFIGKNCFIGSNVNILAPIKIGNNVVVAAGSTICKNVPSNTLVIAREREIHKHNHRVIKRLYAS